MGVVDYIWMGIQSVFLGPELFSLFGLPDFGDAGDDRRRLHAWYRRRGDARPRRPHGHGHFAGPS